MGRREDLKGEEGGGGNCDQNILFENNLFSMKKVRKITLESYSPTFLKNNHIHFGKCICILIGPC